MEHAIQLNFEQSKEQIYSLDLTPIIERLVKVENWNRNQALAACQQYRNYLFLRLKYGKDCILPPSYDIDEVWHAHILHTQQYMDFCYKVFGYYVHHHPSHSKNISLNAELLKSLFEKETQALYFLEFGEYIYVIRKNTLLRRLTRELLNHFKKKLLSLKDYISTAA